MYFFIRLHQSQGDFCMLLCCKCARINMTEGKAFYLSAVLPHKPACALKQSLICFNPCRDEQTLTHGTMCQY